MDNLLSFIAFLIMSAWFINDTDQDVAKAYSMWDMANNQYKLQMYDEAIENFEKCLNVFQRTGEEKEMISKCQASLAFCHFEKGEIEKSKMYLNRIEHEIRDSMWNYKIVGLCYDLHELEKLNKFLKLTKKYERKEK